MLSKLDAHSFFVCRLETLCEVSRMVEEQADYHWKEWEPSDDEEDRDHHYIRWNAVHSLRVDIDGLILTAVKEECGK